MLTAHLIHCITIESQLLYMYMSSSFSINKVLDVGSSCVCDVCKDPSLMGLAPCARGWEDHPALLWGQFCAHVTFMGQQSEMG